MTWSKLPFCKMSGTGNDFIIIDNRQGLVPHPEQSSLTKKLCKRTFSLGADGVIFLEPSSVADIKWVFYNSDGSRAGQCGNGARCATRYAHLHGMGSARITLETEAGIVNASVVNEKHVVVSFPPPVSLQLNYPLEVDGKSYTINSINTGVPHVVLEDAQIGSGNRKKLGSAIRNHAQFPQGTNVNFMTIVDRKNIRVQSYERGVEDFTLACGTGAMSSAIVAHALKLSEPPIRIHVPGGVLTVDFKFSNQKYLDVSLAGDARIICEGEINREAILFEEQSNV